MNIHIPYYKAYYDENTIKTVVEYMSNVDVSSYSIREKTEQAFSKKYNIDRAYLVNSGTSSLNIAIAAAKYIRSDITNPVVLGPAYGHPAWILAAQQLGCTPIFADVKFDTMSLDPRAVETTLRIVDNIIAIVNIDMAGYISEDIFTMKELADNIGAVLIEDSCNALGHKYKDKYAGSFGHFGCYSFSTPKTVTCGEGGMLAIYDTKQLSNRIDIDRLDEFIEGYRYIGNWYNTKYNKNKDKISLGNNYNLSAINSAIIMSQIDLIDKNISNMRNICKMYIDSGIEIFGKTSFASEDINCLSIIMVRKQNAKECSDKLYSFGIENHYPQYKNMANIIYDTSSSTNVSSSLENSVIMLPRSPDISEKDIKLISRVLRQYGDI